MSTCEAVKKWLLAELKANPAFPPILGSPAVVEAAGSDLPSCPGVFVDVPVFRRADRLTDAVRGVVYCSGPTEQGAYSLMSAVEACLFAFPGEPKTWRVPPASKGLRLKRIVAVGGTPPSPVSAQRNKVYVGAFEYEARGKDASAVLYVGTSIA